jgi:hypothetical protein
MPTNLTNKEYLALQYINHTDTSKIWSFARQEEESEHKLTKAKTSQHLGGPVLHQNVASCM